MTETITREQLNEAIEQFADKIMEALGATILNKEASESELTGTFFKAIGLDGTERVVDAREISAGTLILEDVYEHFRCYEGGDVSGTWVCYSGATYRHEKFAEKMRRSSSTPRIIHEG